MISRIMILGFSFFVVQTANAATKPFYLNASLAGFPEGSSIGAAKVTLSSRTNLLGCGDIGVPQNMPIPGFYPNRSEQDLSVTSPGASNAFNIQGNIQTGGFCNKQVIYLNILLQIPGQEPMELWLENTRQKENGSSEAHFFCKKDQYAVGGMFGSLSGVCNSDDDDNTSNIQDYPFAGLMDGSNQSHFTIELTNFSE